MNVKNVINNYKYIKTIGEGTFGKVKLAIHIITGEKVAIKILEKNLIKGHSEYERIEKEIKYLKLFNHPNIIQIYEVIETSSSFYIVMEFAQGGELFNYIVEKEKLTEEESSFYLYQIIQGIKEIHSKKICHRDIKPENLLFTENKILKIIDFGLSKEYEDFLSTPCGSPCYASPEMIKGKKYNGLSVDLWACGIILFAMLCGYLPFDDNNNDGLFKKIIECKIDYPDPVEDEIELSDNALDLINKILTPNPKKRISIEEILEHPFMKYGKKEYNNIIKPDNFRKEELIIDYMINELGFMNKNNIIEKCLATNRHNNITTTFKLLKKKYKEGRLDYTFKEKIMNQLTKSNFVKNLLNNNLSNNNIYLNNNNISFNNHYNSKTNCERKYSKKNMQQEDKKIKINDIAYINNFDFRKNKEKRSKSVSHSNSKKNILSLKDMLKHKNINDRNNIIIINNTNMIQEPAKIKTLYNNLFFKQENTKNQNFKKIETSLSLEKSVNKNNLTLNNFENKLNNTFNINNINMNEHIKVCLKKEESKGNPFTFFRNYNDNQLMGRKKNIYLPNSKFSITTNYKKIDRKKYPNEYFSYKKNSTGMTGFINKINNLYSFEGNTSHNINSSTSKNLNAFSNDNININLNLNSSKNDEILPGSTSWHKKYNNNNIKHIFINNNIINKYKNTSLYKASERNLLKTIELNKENENLKNSFKIKNNIENKKKYAKNIEKICRRFFKQHNRKNIICNKKLSYDNNCNNINPKKGNLYKIQKNINNSKSKNKNKNVYSNKHLNREILTNDSKLEIHNIYNPATSRPHKLNKSINNQLNHLNSKIIFKSILSRNINTNLVTNKTNQNQGESTIETSLKKLKLGLKNNNNLFNNYYKKINLESFREGNEKNERNKKLTNKISTLKNLSPLGNKYNNINSISKIIKKSKINKSIKEILSLKSNFKKIKEKIKYKENIYNILQNEKLKEKDKDKDSILIDSTSRNNITTNSNCNYIPITTRDKKAFISRNQLNENIIKSNTVLLDKNKYLSTERKSNKIRNIKEWSCKSKEKGDYTNMNMGKVTFNENKQIDKRKNQSNVDKFLVANTEMSLYQISYKLDKFCKDNNLICKKDGIYNFIISTKNSLNNFIVEITHSKPLNIVKFFHGKNTESKMKEIITRLFIEIVNF